MQYNCLETQPYLTSDSDLSVENMIRICHIRCRELPVKANFQSAYDNILCFYPACTSEDSQKHICESECFSSGNEIGKENTNYCEIFSGNVRSQVSVMNILFSKLKERER